MQVQAFIENPAGSLENHKYDESSGAYLGSSTLPDAYPHCYGFISNTLGKDGDCVDCFVLSFFPLARGEVYNYEIVGLLEMWENSKEDHKILLSYSSGFPSIESEIERVRDFELEVFGSQDGVDVRVGFVLNSTAARDYINQRMCTKPAAI